MHDKVDKSFKNVVRIACMMAIIGITPAYAKNRIEDYIPSAEKVGEGRLSYVFWDIYDAVLFAPDGKWTEGQPLALQLKYLRDISGKKIADRSTEEIRNLGFDNEVRLADWHAQMRNIFPDVDEGVSLTGIYTDQKETIFYQNNDEIGRISDPEFGRWFFNIWLNEKTSSPDLRRKLLGM